MSNYYQKVDWDDKANLVEKVKALYNILNWLSKEMSIGRVPNNKIELENNLNLTEKRLSTPLSIAFVKMVENGEIDEVTASENSCMFLSWDNHSTFSQNDLRECNGKLYKCLQNHTAQEGWEPENTPALWKLIGLNENGIPEWSRPISAADAYMKGDECMHNGVHKRSMIDNNVWSPDEYPQGWEDVIEEEVVEDLESLSGDTGV